MITADIVPLPENITLLYTGSNAMGNMFMINQSSQTDQISVAVNPDANLLPTAECWLLYNALIPPRHTVTLQELGVSSANGVYVYSQLGVTSFTFTGTAY